VNIYETTLRHVRQDNLGHRYGEQIFYVNSYIVIHEVNDLRHFVWVADPNSLSCMQIFNVEILNLACA
jgi:hypothetical protein